MLYKLPQQSAAGNGKDKVSVIVLPYFKVCNLKHSLGLKEGLSAVCCFNYIRTLLILRRGKQLRFTFLSY